MKILLKGVLLDVKRYERRKRMMVPFLRNFMAVLAVIIGTAGITDIVKSGKDGHVYALYSLVKDPVANSGSNGVYYSADSVPEYTGESYVVLNNNISSFTDAELQSQPYEYYSDLDSLGRCGKAEAMIDFKMMPAEKRGEIGMIKPSGWHTIKYEDVIADKYLYNRCHLIGYQMTGQNANEKNLITGTRYMNVEGMLPWENLISDYIRDTKDRVLYRVTPMFLGNNLVANGVHMEAKSIHSEKVSFNIFVFNVQPGILIDYETGENRRA